MEKVEKLEITLKIILSFIIACIITLIILFFVGIEKVDAQSLTWNTPTYNSINRGYPGHNIEQQKDYSMTVGQVGLLGNLGNYAWAIYDVSKNNINSSYTTLDKGSYSIAFTAVYELWNGYTPLYKLLVFDNGTQYTATCDYGENIEIEPYYFPSFGGTAYKLNYVCEKLNMNLDNITHISIGINTGNNYTINYAQVINNLYMYDLKDGSTDFGGIIANQNKNTEAILNAITGGALKNDTPLDDNELQDYEDAENNLLDEDSLSSINDITINIDSNSNEFVWSLITRMLNTHSLVFGLYITLLSLGLIKLVLNR